MGISGTATVMSIEPLLSVADGPGRLVTATFSRTAGELVQVWLGDDPEPILVTRQHPFFVANEQGWVKAGDLRQGDQLLSEDGEAIEVSAIAQITGPAATQRVHTLEVDGEHRFFAGAQAVMVHNMNWSAALGKARALRPSSFTRAARAAAATARGVVARGGSLHSLARNHVYVIVDTTTGSLVKAGVSGGKRLLSGASARASRQVNKLNRTSPGRYIGRVVADGLSRVDALDIEEMIVDRHGARNLGRQPSALQKLPRANVSSVADYFAYYGSLPNQR